MIFNIEKKTKEILKKEFKHLSKNLMFMSTF